MSAIAGYLKNANANTNDLVGEFHEAVLARLNKGVNTGAVLFALTAKLKNEPADNSEFNWWERDAVSRSVFSAVETSSTSATTLTFDDGAGNSVAGLLNAGDVLMNSNTNEYVQLTADSTDSTAVVVRGFGGSAAVNIGNNDSWVIVTSALAETGDMPRGQYEQPSLYKNYIQIFSRAVQMSRTFKGQVTRIDPNGPIREARIQALERIGNDIELAYFFGRPGVRTDASNGNIYTTGGIMATLDAYNTATGGSAANNVLTGSGTSGDTLNDVDAWIYSVLSQGSDAKLLFCGPEVFSAFSRWSHSNEGGYRTEGSNNIFGINVTELATPYGTIGLAAHPLFKQIPAFHGTGVIVDLAHIVQKVLEPVHLEENLQAPNSLGYREAFIGQLGLGTKFPAAHGYCTNFKKIIANS
jgi:hypothetical protein